MGRPRRRLWCRARVFARHECPSFASLAAKFTFIQRCSEVFSRHLLFRIFGPSVDGSEPSACIGSQNILCFFRNATMGQNAPLLLGNSQDTNNGFDEMFRWCPGPSLHGIRVSTALRLKDLSTVGVIGAIACRSSSRLAVALSSLVTSPVEMVRAPETGQICTLRKGLRSRRPLRHARSTGLSVEVHR